MTQRYPKRICFNFAYKCNMSCSFCYVPFDGRLGSYATARKIINTIADWKIDNITFGGGDPLAHEYFTQLAQYARRTLGEDTIIQVDTNGLLLNTSKIHALAEAVDIIGLPLETISEDVSLRMRHCARYPERVIALLLEIIRCGLSVKVNTVVTKDNRESLKPVGDVLSKFEVRLWSIYQFWPIRPSAAGKYVHGCVTNQEFLAAMAELKALFPNISIEQGLVADRAPGYFFVTQTGRSYAISRASVHEYVEIGSIFDRSVFQRWASQSDPKANEVRSLNRREVLGLTARKTSADSPRRVYGIH